MLECYFPLKKGHLLLFGLLQTGYRGPVTRCRAPGMFILIQTATVTAMKMSSISQVSVVVVAAAADGFRFRCVRICCFVVVFKFNYSFHYVTLGSPVTRNKIRYSIGNKVRNSKSENGYAHIIVRIKPSI